MSFPRHSHLLCVVALVLSCSCAASALDRNAFTFTRYELEVRITPEIHGFAVVGKVTLRNDSNAPQRDIDLQISSSLAWTSIGCDGKTVPYLAQNYTTDVDHTGAVAEAVVTLPQAVAPHASVTLDVAYEGTIQKSTVRLERVGTPVEVAYRTDWDELSTFFMGVRGFGYVTWFPVALDAVSLSEGTTVFDAEAAWMQRHAASDLIVDFVLPAGLTLASNADEVKSAGDHATASFRRVGTRIPTFTIAKYEVMDRPHLTALYLAEHTSSMRDYVAAAEKNMPVIAEWFGAPRQKITIIELTDALASQFESGSVVFLPLRTIDDTGRQLSVVHPIVHASFHSERKWVEEGLAHFMQTLIVEHLTNSRDAGLAFLEQLRPKLAAAEKLGLAPENQARAVPQPLSTTNDEIYFRVKGAYVWVMLRQLIGDDALKQAIRNYRAEADLQPAYVQSLMETPTDVRAPKKDLEWFFDDWVYRDKGLAEFKVDSAYPRESLMQSYIVTVTISNSGNVQADAIVVARSPAGTRNAHALVKANSKAVLRITFPGRPEQIVVNDGTVPEYDRDNNVFDFPQTPNAQ